MPDSFDLLGQLTEDLGTPPPFQRLAVQPPPRWVGSWSFDAAWRQALGLMHDDSAVSYVVGGRVLAHALARSTSVCFDPGQISAAPALAHVRAWQIAEEIELPYEAMYLDFETPAGPMPVPESAEMRVAFLDDQIDPAALTGETIDDAVFDESAHAPMMRGAVAWKSSGWLWVSPLMAAPLPGGGTGLSFDYVVGYAPAQVRSTLADQVLTLGLPDAPDMMAVREFTSLEGSPVGGRVAGIVPGSAIASHLMPADDLNMGVHRGAVSYANRAVAALGLLGGSNVKLVDADPNRAERRKAEKKGWNMAKVVTVAADPDIGWPPFQYR